MSFFLPFPPTPSRTTAPSSSSCVAGDGLVTDWLCHLHHVGRKQRRDVAKKSVEELAARRKLTEDGTAVRIAFAIADAFNLDFDAKVNDKGKLLLKYFHVKTILGSCRPPP